MTDAQLDKATALARDGGFDRVEFRKGYIERPPVEDGSVDVVISNGVINLSPDKAAVPPPRPEPFGPAGGWPWPTSSVSASSRRASPDAALWAACIGGAMQRERYLEAIAQAGFTIELVRRNDDTGSSPSAPRAPAKYGVTSVSLLARRR